MKTRVIELSVNNRKEVIELPINPPSVEFTEKQLNQAITLLNIGEANLKGERGLKYTKLSSFFPSEKSPFYKNAKKKYVLKKGDTVVVHITGSSFYIAGKAVKA